MLMRIAICDDVKEDRKSTFDALNSVIKNFSADEFESGKELVKSHAIFPYDLIILDILMPEINGIETASLIRQTDSHTPIVFVSSSEEFGVASYRVLAFDYLLKPVNPALVKECMVRLLSKQKKKEYVTVMYRSTETKILLSNIEYLESNLRKVIFVLSENRSARKTYGF